MVDTAKNFAKGQLSTGYDASATSIVLNGGHGARFPAVPFNAVWWNVTDYPDPSDDPNVEIVRVTAISTDTLTVTRAQEGTSASTKNTSSKTYKLIAGLTAKSVNTDIQLLPVDRSYLFFRDDQFYRQGSNVPNDIWSTFSNSGGYAVTGKDGEANHPGISNYKTSANSNDDGDSYLGVGATAHSHKGLPRLDNIAGWTLEMIVRLTTITSVGFQFGFRDSGASGIATTANGMWIRFDTSPSDTKWQFITENGSSRTVTDSGITVVAATWYRLKIFCDAAGTIKYQIDNNSPVSVSTNVPANPLSVTHGLITRSAAVRDYDLDLVALYVPNLSR